MMKVLVLGGSGMLGHKLVQVLSNKFDVFTTIRSNISKYAKIDIFNKARVIENIDVSDFSKVRNVLNEIKPDVVINAIGIIKQKKESKDIVKTLEINSLLPHKLAQVIENLETRFITLSTDCVFDGEDGNYLESDNPNALDLYGKSKSLGEVLDGNCLTIRTSIIGREIETSKSLIEWFLNTDETKVKGYTKAIYTGFPTIVLAEVITEIIEKHKELKGLYHISSDKVNKFDLLNLVNNKLKLNKQLEPFDQFTIDRSLDSNRFRKETGYKPPSWEEMIEIMLDDPTPYEEWRKQIS